MMPQGGNRYIAAPKTKPSGFLVELIKDFNIPRSAAGRDIQRIVFGGTHCRAERGAERIL